MTNLYLQSFGTSRVSRDLPRFNDSFQVITAYTQDCKQLPGVLTHEALHAQYFEYPSIQKAVKDFWDIYVRTEIKEWFINTLRKVYDVENEYVLLNEFFAYTLETSLNSKQSSFQKLQDELATDFREFVEEETGISLIQMN